MQSSWFYIIMMVKINIIRLITPVCLYLQYSRTLFLEMRTSRLQISSTKHIQTWLATASQMISGNLTRQSSTNCATSQLPLSSPPGVSAASWHKYHNCP